MSKAKPNLLECAVNSRLTPYLFGFLGWTLMWQFQVFLTKAIPPLDFALGVSLIFLPAGIRTLSVLIFGFKGAVGVFFGAMLSTLEYMGHVASMDFAVHTVIGAISAFSAWVAMVAVCHIRKIDDDLSQIGFDDVLAIVFCQQYRWCIFLKALRAKVCQRGNGVLRCAHVWFIWVSRIR